MGLVLGREEDWGPLRKAIKQLLAMSSLRKSQIGTLGYCFENDIAQAQPNGKVSPLYQAKE
jgi:hypothetical protein